MVTAAFTNVAGAIGFAYADQTLGITEGAGYITGVGTAAAKKAIFYGAIAYTAGTIYSGISQNWSTYKHNLGISY